MVTRDCQRRLWTPQIAEVELPTLRCPRFAGGRGHRIHAGEVATLLRSGEVNDIRTLHREGLSISAISRLTGFDRKTIRSYLRDGGIPRYGPRAPRPSKSAGGGSA
jgi:hypothetical protein